MLQKLSYINLIFAIIYGLVYLKSGNFNSTTGVLSIIIFNWLFIRAYQFDDYKWIIWHYLPALWSIYFVGTILYGIVNIVKISVQTDFVSNDTLTNLSISTLFSILVLVHLIGYWKKSLSS